MLSPHNIAIAMIDWRKGGKGRCTIKDKSNLYSEEDFIWWALSNVLGHHLQLYLDFEGV